MKQTLLNFIIHGYIFFWRDSRYIINLWRYILNWRTVFPFPCRPQKSTEKAMLVVQSVMTQDFCWLNRKRTLEIGLSWLNCCLKEGCLSLHVPCWPDERVVDNSQDFCVSFLLRHHFWQWFHHFIERGQGDLAVNSSGDTWAALRVWVSASGHFWWINNQAKHVLLEQVTLPESKCHICILWTIFFGILIWGFNLFVSKIFPMTGL